MSRRIAYVIERYQFSAWCWYAHGKGTDEASLAKDVRELNARVGSKLYRLVKVTREEVEL